MSLEAWSTLASFSTVAVIAATAVAALIQLRHMRSGNQITVITVLQSMLESQRLTDARRFVAEEVPRLIADPEGRSKLGAEILPAEIESIRDVANFFETMGAFVKFRIADRALVLDLFDGVVYKAWKQLEPVVMIRRQLARGSWASFEYLAVLCEKSLSQTQGDYYPRGVPRMRIEEGSRKAAEAFVTDRGDAAQSAPIP